MRRRLSFVVCSHEGMHILRIYLGTERERWPPMVLLVGGDAQRPASRCLFCCWRALLVCCYVHHDGVLLIIACCCSFLAVGVSACLVLPWGSLVCFGVFCRDSTGSVCLFYLVFAFPPRFDALVLGCNPSAQFAKKSNLPTRQELAPCSEGYS